MKKILFAIHSLRFGGAERSLMNLLHELPKGKYEVDLLLFQKEGEYLKQIPSWVNILETPKELNGLYSPVKRVNSKTLTKITGTVCSKIIRKTKKGQYAFRWKYFYKHNLKMLDNNYDIAVAYVGTEVMYYVRDFVESHKKMVWIHNDYRTAGYSEKDDKEYLEDMDAIVSVSRKCVDVLNKIFPEYTNKIYCIENITSSAMIKKQAEEFWPTEYEDGVFNILSIGRLAAQKGFDIAIGAAEILKNNGIKFCWYIIGEGILKKTLESQIQMKKLEDNVILLGARSNPYPYIKNCSILVQPSRYEGKSVVLDETKILCKPIVASAYPTVADQIVDGKEGIICNMSESGIAEGIYELISNERKQNRIKEYLQSNEYGNSFEIEKYMELFDTY